MIRRLYLLTLLFATSSFSQDWKQDTCDLLGPVKMVEYNSIEYYEGEESMTSSRKDEYNYQGYLVISDRIWTGFLANRNGIKRVYDKSGTDCLKEYRSFHNDTSRFSNMVYNAEGQLEKQELYNDGRHWSTFNYVYNEQGLVIEEFVVIQKDMDTNHRYFGYDDQGRMIKDEDISERSKEMRYWTYNDAGQLIEHKLLDSNWTKHSYYEENDEGEMVLVREEDYTNSAFTEDSYFETYEYDEKGQLIREYSTDPDGTPRWEILRTYDENGVLIAKKSGSLKDDEEPSNYTYTYEFDEYGNWISKTTYKDGELDEEETRVITYY